MKLELAKRLEAAGYPPDRAYNSDELIAAILERFDPTDIEIEKAGGHWAVCIIEFGMGWITAPTLLSALVNLYCKLAQNNDTETV